MNDGEIFIGIASVGAACAIVAMLANLVLRLIAFHERKLEILAGQTAEKAAQYAAHTRELEERLRVVERIVTDRNEGLAARIEALDMAGDMPGATAVGARISN